MFRRELTRIFRRYRLLFGVLTLIVVLIRVPLVPYSPSCWERSSVGPVFLSPRFREELVEGLQIAGAPYVAIHNLVLIRFWDWFADPDDRLINASDKAVSSLIDPDWGADVSSIPPRVRDLIAETAREHGGDIWPTCKLVRAVAIEGW